MDPVKFPRSTFSLRTQFLLATLSCLALLGATSVFAQMSPVSGPIGANLSKTGMAAVELTNVGSGAQASGDVVLMLDDGDDVPDGHLGFGDGRTYYWGNVFEIGSEDARLTSLRWWMRTEASADPDVVISMFNESTGERLIDLFPTVSPSSDGRWYELSLPSLELAAGEFFSVIIGASGSIPFPAGYDTDARVLGASYFSDDGQSYSLLADQSGFENAAYLIRVAASTGVEPMPDLIVSGVTPPSEAFSGQPVEISWIVENVGEALTTVPEWKDYVYLSEDDVLNKLEDVLLGSALNGSYLEPDQAYAGREVFTLPQGVSGSYQVFVVTDHDSRQQELNEENNTGRSTNPAQIRLTPPPDLQVTAAAAPRESFSGQTVDVSWTVRNDGATATGTEAWTDAVFISTDDLFNRSEDRLLQTFAHTGTLAPGASYSQFVRVRLPDAEFGTYHLLFVADFEDEVFEHVGENNNARASEELSISLTPPPDFVVAGMVVPRTGRSGESIPIDWTVQNQGAGAPFENAWSDRVYLSQSPVLDTGSAHVLTTANHGGVVAAGDSYSTSRMLTLPDGIEGAYYVFVVTDWNGEVFEFSAENEGNNATRSPDAINIQLSPWPDLQVSAVELPASVTAGDQVRVSFTVANRGQGDAGVSNWRDYIYISSSPDRDESAQVIDRISHSGPITAGASYTSTTTLTLPHDRSGPQYLFVSADEELQVYEHTDEENNLGRSSAVSMAAYPPVDLEVRGLSVPATGSSGQAVDLGWTVENVGMGATLVSNWYDVLYLSDDGELGPGDLLLQRVSHYRGLRPQESYDRAIQFVLPNGVSGDFHLLLENTAEDADAGNNVASAPIRISLSPSPDLRISALNVPADATAGQPATIEWTVLNDGEGPPARDRWYDSVFLSRDGVLDSADDGLATVPRDGAVSPGASYTAGADVVLPLFTSGDYFVIVRSDDRNDVYEQDAEVNNTQFAPVRIVLPPPSDLVPTSVQGPAVASPGETVAISWTIQNDGANPATGLMHDALYVSADAHWTVDDPVIGILSREVDLQPGADLLVSYTAELSKAFRADAEGNLTEELPGISPGSYYVIVRTDIRNNIRESSDANNALASSALMEVGMPLLSLGVPVTTTLTQDQERFYRLDVPARATLRVLLDSDSEDSANELFVRHGDIPTRSRFDARNQNAFQADQELLVPKALSGTHFLAVRSELSPAAGQSVTILADTVSFELTNVTPAEAGNVGSVTLRIEGARLDSFTTVTLRPSGADDGGKIRPTWARLANAGLLYATFDLRGVSSGSYDVVAVSRPFALDADSTTYEWFMAVDSLVTVLPAAFRVVPGGGGRLEAKLRLPESARLGNDFPVVIDVANLGNTDLPAPLLTIVSPNETPLSTGRPIRGAGLRKVDVVVLAPEGRRDVLAPGQRASVKFYARAAQLPGSLLWLQEDADPRIGPSEFQVYFDRFRPGNDWQPAWQAFGEIVGSSADDYAAALRRAALLRNPGFLNRDYFFGNELVQDLVAKAWGISEGTAYAQFGDTTPEPFSFAGTAAGKAGAAIRMTMRGDPSTTGATRKLNIADARPSSCGECELSDAQLALVATEGEAAARLFYETKWGKYAGEMLLEFINGTGGPLMYGSESDLVNDLLADADVQSHLDGVETEIRLMAQNGGYASEMQCGETKTIDLEEMFAHDPGWLVTHYDFNGQGLGLALALGNIHGYIEGHVTITKSCSCNGCCASIDVTSHMFVYLFDLFDFCPATGDRSNPARAYITFLVEQLEACGWGKEVPVHVSFAVPPRSQSVDCKKSGGTEGEPACCKDPRPGNENFCAPPLENNTDGCGSCPPDAGFPVMVVGPSGNAERADNVPSVASCDPNDMLGPAGFGDDKWVSASQVLPYTIRFENDPLLATAAAQVVTVSHHLDDTVDPRTFRLGSFGFGPFQFDVPENSAFFSQRLDVRDSLGMFVDATAGIDVASNEAFWVFRTIDPATGTAPTDPRAGFLAVNDSLHNGEGFVTYSIRPKPTARTRDLVDVEASIFFDRNAPIDTPPLFNTIDAEAPMSTLSYVASDETGYHLEFSGEDEGSGIRDYALYVSTDGGTFQLHESGITGPSAVFVPEPGHRYRAFSIASDNAGNIELMKSGGQAIVVQTEEGVELPESFALYPNYPNPFNPSTVVPFDLPESAEVAMTVYNLLGQRVARFALGRLSSGRHQHRVDLSTFASGVYFYEFTARSETDVLFREVRKFVLVK